MKLSFVLSILIVFQLKAESYAQKINLTVKDAPLSEVIYQLRKQSGYDFLYNNSSLKDIKPITLNAVNADLLEVLNKCIAGQPLQYAVNNKTIFITRKPVSAQAEQVTTISGKVTDDKGEPLVGVSVSVKNGGSTTVTDAGGNFKVNVADTKRILVFSYVGFETAAVPLNGRTTVNVVLKPETQGLDEVVVVAYGTQKKSDITGAVSSIKAGAIEDMPVVSIEQLLKGQAAGVQASVSSGTPGSASNINIRGVSSIGASTQPLYVVDGLPIAGQSIETDFSEARTGMDFINPDDIESIEILKDASATAIYGARGANGVILITTKSGKIGSSTTTFTASSGFTTMANKIDMLTTRQTQEYWELAKARDGQVIAPLNPARLDVNTDWQDVTSQTALTQKYNLGFQGGQQKLQYYLSLDYLDQDGLLKYTKYNRYSIRGTLSSQVSDKLRVENRVTITQSKNDGAFTGGQGGTANATGATQRILQAPTYLKVNSKDPGIDPETGEKYIDPLVILRDLSDDIKITNITEQLTLKYNITPSLTFQSMAGLTYRFFDNDQYQGAEYAATKSDTRITAKVRSNTTTNYINENTLTYKKKTGSHNFTFLLGNTLQQEVMSGTTITAIDFPNTTTGTNALQNAKEATVSSFKQQWQLESFFGRVNYDLNGKYLLTATLRRDGSSKLAAGNKWGTFPSVALGWRVSEEPFLKKADWLSNFKVRASWGQIGNSEIGVYQTLSTISSGTNGFDNELLPYYTLDRYGDPNLRWEISQQTDLGVDMEFLKGKISVTADIYDKRTKDLLLAQPTSLSTGYGSYLTNVGSMTNQGFELTVNYQVMQKKTFQWTSNVNFSILRNQVTDVGDVGIIGVGQAVDGKNPRYLAVGKSIGTFYLVKTAGVWQLGEEAEAAVYGAKPGDWKFVDQNNDKVIDNDDRVFVGDAVPKYNIGFSNTFKYKKFDLTVLLTGDFGAQVLNAVKPNLWLARENGAAAYDLEAWSPSNPTNKLAAPSIHYNSEFLHDGYLENADIVRIQNVRLGYSLNLKTRKRSTIYFYFSGSNVWSFTGYDGYDPEVGNGINRGIDRFAYPRGRIYNFGGKLSF
ncbi:TonB-dependent receptor [Pedobacter sp. BS3]|uniref:TonB-dependent receptor n=1 Tax=Pedobacter sp. BS3 TaxID=2567937 RepID=UPI0016594845|nr:TonB-dependent receptor [Pedobacter sp. BS3]